MSLAAIYPSVKPAIVAFVPKFRNPADRMSRLPAILGTGFFVTPDGLVMTNDHVVKAFAEIWRPDRVCDEEWGVQAIQFFPTETGLSEVRMNVLGIHEVAIPRKTGFRPLSKPDIALVQLNATETPHVSIDACSLRCEGEEIATSGFPLGRHAMLGPAGHLQCSPTLQRGVISALLPYPMPKPEAFAVNIMSHGGASGSPVFSTETGEVLGMLFSSLHDMKRSRRNDEIPVPTSISYAIPGPALQNALENRQLPAFAQSRPLHATLVCKGLQKSP